jgi:hypothetical protein
MKIVFIMSFVVNLVLLVAIKRIIFNHKEHKEHKGHTEEPLKCIIAEPEKLIIHKVHFASGK